LAVLALLLFPLPGKDAVNYPLVCPLETCERLANRGFEQSHRGIDLQASIGSSVYAADSGIIGLSGLDKNDGAIRITILHDDDVITGYWHLSEVLVYSGEEVDKGELIAYSGQTGRADWPHVHFLVIDNGVYEDPENWIEVEVLDIEL